MRARTRRLWMIAIAGGFLLGAAGLAGVALRQTADLFYTPTRLAEAGGPTPGLRAKIGGFVETGSLAYGEGAEVSFKVIDDAHAIGVTYTGVTPDLFKEGAGVVAEGVFGPSGTFQATRLLAKHDENYVPRELKGVGGSAS